MTDLSSRRGDERFLICAPTGRDAALTRGLLSKAALDAEVCRDVDTLCARAEQEGAAGLLLAEEVLGARAVSRLHSLLNSQEAWSDLPILVFTGEPASIRTREPLAKLLLGLGNVTLLDRPLQPITMISAVRAALRARKRQYASRSELQARQLAVQSRDQFLAMLGHELRNPLAAIEMAVKLDKGGDHARYRDIVRRQSAHLARLVDDLLDVARVTSGKVVLQKTPLDFCELVRRCALAHAASIEAHHLELTVNTPPHPVMIEADGLRLEQIVNNLITNATKYSPEGGNIRISVSLEENEAIVRVADDGVGIAPEMLLRIFDLFTQIDGTLDRAKGGMGIGLTLVRNMVELHGGRVFAESPGLGCGSVFTVHLPALLAPTGHASPESRAGAKPQPASGLDVLLIEDNADTREMLADFLEEQGFRVYAAPDGLRGVELALHQRPRALVVDIGLPGLNGYEVAREVRKRVGQDPYLIALSGYGLPDDRRRALEAGFDVHLTKPVAIDSLVEQLNSLSPVRSA